MYTHMYTRVLIDKRIRTDVLAKSYNYDYEIKIQEIHIDI